MKTYIKIILSLIVSIGSFFFIYWILFAFLTANDGISIPITIFLSLLLGTVSYILLSRCKPGPGIYVFFGGFIIGCLSFLIGYLLPEIFGSTTKQGQFIGTFISGPIGFVIGLMIGGIVWLRVVKKHPERFSL